MVTICLWFQVFIDWFDFFEIAYQKASASTIILCYSIAASIVKMVLYNTIFTQALIVTHSHHKYTTQFQYFYTNHIDLPPVLYKHTQLQKNCSFMQIFHLHTVELYAEYVLHRVVLLRGIAIDILPYTIIKIHDETAMLCDTNAKRNCQSLLRSVRCCDRLNRSY